MMVKAQPPRCFLIFALQFGDVRRNTAIGNRSGETTNSALALMPVVRRGREKVDYFRFSVQLTARPLTVEPPEICASFLYLGTRSGYRQQEPTKFFAVGREARELCVGAMASTKRLMFRNCAHGGRRQSLLAYRPPPESAFGPILPWNAPAPEVFAKIFPGLEASKPFIIEPLLGWVAAWGSGSVSERSHRR